MERLFGVEKRLKNCKGFPISERRQRTFINMNYNGRTVDFSALIIDLAKRKASKTFLI
jgi:hypothetical protein